MLLLAYKVKYPANFFMLRGNHECASINRIYGFYDECKLAAVSKLAARHCLTRHLSTGKNRFNIRMWKNFNEVFNCLPVAAIIDEKIFCLHGGLSPELTRLEQIRRMPRPTDVPRLNRPRRGDLPAPRSSSAPSSSSFLNSRSG